MKHLCRRRIAILFALGGGLLGLTTGCAYGFPPYLTCEQYIDCQHHFETSNGLPLSELSQTYAKGGTCWENAMTSDSCSTACDNAVASLKEQLEEGGKDVGPCG